jgi:hypothetical protein
MMALAPVGPKLSKLLALLSSDHDGEVIAAARAIGRTLGNAGLSFHDLAAALTGSARGEQVAHPSWAELSRSERLDVLDKLLASNVLSGWERAFCKKTYAWLHLRPGSQLSVKQRAVVDELIAEVL